MAVITGGRIIEPSTNPGVKPRIYWADGVPTDTNIGVASPANGTVAVNLANGQVYERQLGVWTRVDTV